MCGDPKVVVCVAEAKRGSALFLESVKASPRRAQRVSPESNASAREEYACVFHENTLTKEFTTVFTDHVHLYVILSGMGE